MVHLGKRIVVIGAGAIGGYAGGHMTRAGHDVTLIDAWPDHVEYLRKHGLRLSGMTAAERHSIPVKALHITDVQSFVRERAFDIAFMCVKSYDTEWATHLIKPYLAATGLSGNQRDLAEGSRWLSIRLGSEAIRVGQALGYQLERMLGMEPETLARAGEGNRDALAEIVDILVENAKKRSDEQRPSMAQDMFKGRRTETDFINGYVAACGEEIGVPAPTHAKMNQAVKQVERGERKSSPQIIEGF